MTDNIISNIEESIDDEMEPIKTGLSEHSYSKLRTHSLIILASFSVVYTIYYASDILIPITISLLLSLILRPLVRALSYFRLPTPISAALIVGSIVCLLGYGVFKLSEPASEWINRAPELVDNAQQKIEPFRQSLTQLQEVREKVEEISTTSEGHTSDAGSPTEIIQASVDLPTTLQASTTFLLNCVFVTVLVFLILASDGSYLRKVVKVLPTFADKRRAVELTIGVEACISRYLATITTINVGVGVATAITMWALDMPNPLLWGVLATILNFIPYVGPAATGLIILLVSFFSFESFDQMIAPAFAFLIITAIEGQLVTPLSTGKQLNLSPVAIFVFLGFMGWLWGAVGMLIAIPLLASIKIVCAQLEPLNPMAVMLGTDS